jgi:urea transporter
MDKGLLAIFLSIPAIVCCGPACWPVSLAIGIVGMILGSFAIKEEKARGEDGMKGTIGYYLCLVAVTIAVFFAVSNILLSILYPNMVEDMMKDMGWM